MREKKQPTYISNSYLREGWTAEARKQSSAKTGAEAHASFSRWYRSLSSNMELIRVLSLLKFKRSDAPKRAQRHLFGSVLEILWEKSLTRSLCTVLSVQTDEVLIFFFNTSSFISYNSSMHWASEMSAILITPLKLYNMLAIRPSDARVNILFTFLRRSFLLMHSFGIRTAQHRCL